MANPNKFTTKEVLNKVLLDSSGNAVTANSVTAQEALNTVLDTTNNRLNMSLAGGTISGDVTISGDLTVSGGGSLTFDETVTGNMTLTKDVDSEFVALVLTNQSDANSTAGSVSQRFDLEDTSGTAVDSAKILVSKEAAFTSTASTQDSNMAFFTSENGTLSEAVRIASSRSLSINNSQFYIWSDDYFGTNYEVLRIDKPSGSNARISVYNGGSGTARGLDFELGGSNKISIDSTGITKLTSNTNSNLHLDTASATSEPRIIAINDANSAYVTLGLYAEPLELKRGQINFPDTQNASTDENTLDDYQEGTWTPILCEMTTVANNMDLHADSGGIFTKVGNLVFASCYIQVTGNGDATNETMGVHGLPFTAKNTPGNKAGIVIGENFNLGLASGSRLGGFISPGTATLFLKELTNNAYSTVTRDEISNDAFFSFTVTYIADA